MFTNLAIAHTLLFDSKNLSIPNRDLHGSEDVLTAVHHILNLKQHAEKERRIDDDQDDDDQDDEIEDPYLYDLINYLLTSKSTN